MGEAKEKARKLDELGPTRVIHFEGRELTALFNWMFADAAKKDKARKLASDKRRAFRSALRQMGLLKIWEGIRSGKIKNGEVPKGGRVTLTTDAIDTLLEQLKVEMDYSETFEVGEIEERLLDAKAGLYELPPEDLKEVEGEEDNVIQIAADPQTPPEPGQEVAP